MGHVRATYPRILSTHAARPRAAPVHDAAGDHPAQAHCTNSVPLRMYIRNGLATPPGRTTVQTGCAYAGGEVHIPQQGSTCAVKRLQSKLQRAACHTIQIRAACSDATLFPPKTFFARPVMATAPWPRRRTGFACVSWRFWLDLIPLPTTSACARTAHGSWHRFFRAISL